MSIEKKSLINTLKTAKKANIVKEEVTVSGATISPVAKGKAFKNLAMKHKAFKAAAMKNKASKSTAKKR